MVSLLKAASSQESCRAVVSWDAELLYQLAHAMLALSG